MGLRVIKAPLDKPSRTTVRTENTIGPAQVANRFKAFGIIDEILDIDHCEEPDWKARKKSSQHQDKPVGLPFQDNSPESIMSLKAFGIIDEILDIGHCEEPDWKARKKSSQHQDKPVGLPFQDNSPESIMSLKEYGALWPGSPNRRKDEV